MKRGLLLTAAAVVLVLGLLTAILIDPQSCEPTACPPGFECDQLCYSLIWPHVLIAVVATALAIAVGILALRGVPDRARRP